MRHLALASGHHMPMLGLGTWKLSGDACTQAVRRALDLGYTHIDTAWMYENQRAIGNALREAGTERERLFITSKVWHTHLHHDGVLEQCDETLRDLQTDYVDLFLIHWPSDKVPMAETFKALGRLADEGKARSIGVSNFSVARMEEAQSVSDVPVCVNQIKYHAGQEQRDVRDWCQAHRVAVTAYTPLGRGQVLDAPPVTEASEAHGRTPAQVALRWLVQQDIIVIPKAGSEAHMKENQDLFDWSLTNEEMAAISRPADDGKPR